MSTNEIVSQSTVYWITRLDAVNWTLQGIVAMGLIAGLFLVAFGHIEEEPKVSKCGKRALTVAAIATLALILTPTTKQAVAIAVIPAIANNQDVQGLGADLVTTAREWLQELRPVKETK